MDEKTIKERINKALVAVNGIDFIDRPVHFLSYGQKKSGNSISYSNGK